MSFTFKQHFEGNFSIIFQQQNVYYNKPILIIIKSTNKAFTISLFQLGPKTGRVNSMDKYFK